MGEFNCLPCVPLVTCRFLNLRELSHCATPRQTHQSETHPLVWFSTIWLPSGNQSNSQASKSIRWQASKIFRWGGCNLLLEAAWEYSKQLVWYDRWLIVASLGWFGCTTYCGGSWVAWVGGSGGGSIVAGGEIPQDRFHSRVSPPMPDWVQNLGLSSSPLLPTPTSPIS